MNKKAFKKHRKEREQHIEHSRGTRATRGRSLCLDITHESATSHLKASDGREIPFIRAILTFHNVCELEAVSVVAHAALG